MELARALAARPQLLLLDETLAGLGAGEIEELLAPIAALAQAGRTIVIIEHTMHAMVRLADRLLVLDHGACCDRRAGEVIARPAGDRSLSRQEMEGPC